MTATRNKPRKAPERPHKPPEPDQEGIGRPLPDVRVLERLGHPAGLS
jgi:hypothetical protein